MDNNLYCNDFDEVEYELMYYNWVWQQIFWVFSAAALESGVGAWLPGRLPIAKWPFGEFGGVNGESASSVSQNLFNVDDFKNYETNLNGRIISSSYAYGKKY